MDGRLAVWALHCWSESACAQTYVDPLGSPGGYCDGIVGRFDDKERYLVTDYMIAVASGNYKRLAEIIKTDIAKWAKVIKDANITAAN